MERKTPKDISNPIHWCITNGNNISLKKYYKNLLEFETEIENHLIDFLKNIECNAIVKTDKFSLPYKNEIEFKLGAESYLNGPYEYWRGFRKILNEIINNNIYNLRFYILVEIDDDVKNPYLRGNVIYKFRYSPQNKKY